MARKKVKRFVYCEKCGQINWVKRAECWECGAELPKYCAYCGKQFKRRIMQYCENCDLILDY